jgi:predicted dehydrogenase
MVLNGSQAKELYALAEERGLVLLEASKTAYCPAFNHLLALVKSGVIGDVIDVRASLSKLTQGHPRELDATQAGGSMTELSPFPLLSIIKLLGMGFEDIQFYSKMKDGVDVFTKGIINYQHAVSTITLGLGVKTEGNLIVSGTKGYVYVPAPWWLTDYFEIRYENQSQNKKYFYSYEGDGLRYELQEFASMVFNHRLSSYHLRRHESCAIAGIIEKFLNRENFREI